MASPIIFLSYGGVYIVSEFSKQLIERFNKKSNGEVAFLIEDGSTTDVKGWIPTGSLPLDFIIANKKGGGIPIGKLSAIEGLESTGKSLMAMQIMANAQKMGGLAIYMDTEHALNIDFAERVGLDTKNNFIHLFPPTVEMAFTLIYELIDQLIKDEAAAKKEKRELPYKFVALIWDSVTATPTKLDLEAQNPDPSSSIGVKARALSKNMQTLVGMTGRHNLAIVFINQLRKKIGAMPLEDPWDIPGGKAIPFYSSLRIRLQSVGKIKIASTKQTVGVKTKAKILKTRFGPAFREALFPIYFTHGIDDEESILDCLLENKKVVKVNGGQKGSLFYFKGDKEEGKINKREFKNTLMNDPKARAKACAFLEDVLVTDLTDPRKSDLETDESDGEGE